MKLVILIFFFFILSDLTSQTEKPYWNRNTGLIPWRLPLITDQRNSKFTDLDEDGDPDILKTMILDDVPILWIDDDDDMKWTDLEGDTDNDCLLIDKGKDGIFAGPDDLSIDWTDTNGDGVAEVQLIAQSGGIKSRYNFDWSADFMYIIDWGEKDGIKNFINWNDLILRAWEHNGHSNFFTDYHGNTLFLKMHGSTFRIYDLRFNWENPFIFYDFDKDNLSEMAIRLVDTPKFRSKPGEPSKPEFEKLPPEIDIQFTQKIDYAAITWDLDNDNGQGNEFDFDMSLKFSGNGFEYADQIHRFKNMRGLPDADKYFYDARWRQIDELIYADQNVAYDKIFKEGIWDYCWFVFDEDDDCNRWERVEFYEPKSLWKIGGEKGGIDNNKQADAAGDRGEFDLDNSGKGNLYIAPFDGRLHLFGAEWGAWRIDLNAGSFQGYGGLYPPAKNHVRDQIEPEKFASVKYSDTDHNGFFDRIEYDLNGDTIFEQIVNLKDLGISDSVAIIKTSKLAYPDLQKLFKKVAEKQFVQAIEAIRLAKSQGINPDWYAFWMNPRNLQEKYQYGFWLNFYLYMDIRHVALINKNQEWIKKLDKAFYSGDWSKLKGSSN